MRLLAWDDDLDDDSYFRRLKRRFEGLGVEFELHALADEVIQLLEQVPFPFTAVVSDYLDNHDPDLADGESAERGRYIFERCQARGIPIYFVTTQPHTAEAGLGVGRARIFSKGAPTFEVATSIRDRIREEGRDTLDTAVFLASNVAGAFRQPLINKLEEWGLEVLMVGDRAASRETLEEVREKMTRASVILVLATADDVVCQVTASSENWPTERPGQAPHQPRPNVLMEIGMAVGIGRGLDKLVILQQRGNHPSTFASLPTNLGGVLTIDFQDDIAKCWDRLAQSLRDRNVRLSL